MWNPSTSYLNGGVIGFGGNNSQIYNPGGECVVARVFYIVLSTQEINDVFLEAWENSSGPVVATTSSVQAFVVSGLQISLQSGLWIPVLDASSGMCYACWGYSVSTTLTKSTTDANDWLLGAVFTTGSTYVTAGTNYVSVGSYPIDPTVFDEYQQVSSTGTYTATFSLTQAEYYTAYLGAFEVATS